MNITVKEIVEKSAVDGLIRPCTGCHCEFLMLMNCKSPQVTCEVVGDDYDVKDIVKDHLIRYGYDGLVAMSDGCGCSHSEGDGLFLCGVAEPDCQAAYLNPDSNDDTYDANMRLEK